MTEEEQKQLDSEEKEVLHKAVNTADALATGGKFQQEQFIKEGLLTYIFREDNDVWGRARRVTFHGDSAKIDRMGVGKRVALRRQEAVDPGRLRSVHFDKIEMDTMDIVVPWEITPEMIRNFMQNAQVGLEEVILRSISDKLANEMKTVALFGQKNIYPSLPSELDFETMVDAEGYLLDQVMAGQDGLLALIERDGTDITPAAAVYDANNGAISPQFFSAARRKLPQKYHKLPNLGYLMSTTLSLLHQESYMARNDALGVATVNGGMVGARNIIESSLLDYEPTIVKRVKLDAEVAVSLGYKNISNVVVLPDTIQTLGKKSQIPAIAAASNFTLDTAAGTIARIDGGAISDGDYVVVRFTATPLMALMDPSNFIIGFSLDSFNLLRGKNIRTNVDEWVLHARVGFQLENTEACSLVKNIKTTL